MHIDITLLEKDLRRAGALAGAAESAGHNGVWCTEAGSDPFLQAYSAITSTSGVEVGTAIAVALARTPMTVAYSAWNLADVSDGRFILGLGSQVKSHIERRYSMPWVSPVAQMREFVEATKEIWTSWRTGEKLEHAGRFYTHTLMSPFWAPAPHDHRIPVHVAAVGPQMTEMAGAVADGVLLHTFTNRAYLDSVTFPALDRGLVSADRQASDITLSVPLFMIMGDTDEALAEQHRKTAKQLAFYASTPSYRPVLEAIGFGDLQNDLTALSKRGAWDDMTALVSNELIEYFAISGRPEEMPALARRHLGDRIGRTTSYFGWPISDPARLEAIFADFNRKEATA